MNRVAVAVLMLALLGVAACGNEDDGVQGRALTGHPLAEERDAAAEDSSLLSPWTRALREALAGTNRILVRKGGNLDAPSRLELLCEVRGADAAWDMIRRISLDDEYEEECECSGQTTLQFYGGSTLKGVVTYHHGERLGMSEEGPWTGQATLTPESQTLVLEWLVGKGIDVKLLRLSPSRAKRNRSK